MSSKRLFVAGAVAALMLATASVCLAADKNGVDPSRLKLPTGPGSIEGIGENPEPSTNMGTVSYAVPFALPAGYQGFTPSIGLRYSSGAGNSEAGIGWSLGVPTIERTTARGLPRYNTTDLFAASGGEELVRLPGSNIYRARYEGGFVRYRWADSTGEIQLTDLNGDGLADVVVVRATSVLYALNQNGSLFDVPVEVSQVAGGAIPERTSSVSVRLADTNGSGSTDVVWIDASGRVTYLELFPERPNLLVKRRPSPVALGHSCRNSRRTRRV